MKRQYNKPELFFEEYELTEAIASNCGNEEFRDCTNYNNYRTCTVDMGVGFMFVDQTHGCDIEPFEGDSFCYEHFGNQMMVFNS